MIEKEEVHNNSLHKLMHDQQETAWLGKYFRHIRFADNLIIRMDGKKGIALIECPECKK